MKMVEETNSRLASLERGSERFYSRFIRVGALGLTVTCIVVVIGVVVGTRSRSSPASSAA